MALTRVSPALFQVSNNITSVTVGGSANTISLTFDSNGVITGASNNAVSVSNTAITGNIISSQITSVANTQITGNIISSQITSNPTLYGNVSVTGVIGVGGATPSTSGSGISFPATQSASSNANTLDDYEEGNWTGTVEGSSADPTTPVTNTGSYTKIGRQVFARISFPDINTTGATGEFFISGLPFSSAQAIGTGNVMTYNIISFPSAGNLCPYVAGTNINIYYMVSAGVWVAAQHNAGTSRFLELSVTYNV